MIIIYLAIVITNLLLKDAYCGLIAVSVRETFILPEEYLLVCVLYCLFTHCFLTRADTMMNEHYFCRIRSRRTYLYTQLILVNVCTIFLWMTNLNADSSKWLVRLAFLFICCNIQILLRILLSPIISLIGMFSQLVLSMFADYHIFPGDIAMECRQENVFASIAFYLILILCMWFLAAKKIKETDVGVL